MPTAPAGVADLPNLLAQLASFSAPGPGVTRRAFDDAWCDAHLWLCDQARVRGLDAGCDAAGNLMFCPPGASPGDPALWVGSHLDSVVHGGRYDGAYGLLAGLLLAAELRGAGGTPVIAFGTCEEEESRFRGALLGARTLLGRFTPHELEALTDDAGVSLRSALGHAHARDCAAPFTDPATAFRRHIRPTAMLELHIEQGPVLESEGVAIGIVEHIAGYRRMRASIAGAARHSGTTPMRLRRDALAAAAEMALVAEALARETGEPAVATAGFARATPGLHNVVPGTCDLGLEVRHVEAGRLSALADALAARCREIAERRGVTLTWEEVSQQDPVALSPELAGIAAQVAEDLGVSAKRMASGAAHDSMVFAREGIPSLMIFVPSQGGVSHAPEEHTEPAQLAAGYTFLVALARRLTQAPERVA